MEKENLKEYIESKEYFRDARLWYNWKYMLPMSHRVWFFYAALTTSLILISLAINVNKLLPIKQKLTYAIKVISDIREGETQAQVIEMNGFTGPDAPFKFIASNLIRNYITSREDFDYSMLKQQFQYIKATSTRLVFRRYYNYMSVNNPESPVMRYQQYATRKININSIKFTTDRHAIITFTSSAKDSNGNKFENLKWEANLSFNMGQVGKRSPTGTEFKFLVTDYKLKLLGEVE